MYCKSREYTRREGERIPNNFLITGSPGSGKTTVVERTSEILKEKDLKAGGIYCPEIKSNGIRKGFKIIDIASGESKILAHVDLDNGPKISKYRVNISNIDEICKYSIPKALREADFLIIDEIAPMEVHSEEFKKQVKKALESEKPTIGVIHKRSKSGFIGEVKRRKDARIFGVNKNNRDQISKELANLILENM